MFVHMRRRDRITARAALHFQTRDQYRERHLPSKHSTYQVLEPEFGVEAQRARNDLLFTLSEWIQGHLVGRRIKPHSLT